MEIVTIIIAVIGALPLVMAYKFNYINKHWRGIVFGLLSLICYGIVSVLFQNVVKIGLNDIFLQIIKYFGYFGIFGSIYTITCNALNLMEKKGPTTPLQEATEKTSSEQ